MKKGRTTLVAGFLVLGFLAFLTFVVARAFWHWFSDIESDQALAIVALGGLVLTPLISFFTTRAIERRKLTTQASLERKIEVYEEFLQFFVTMMKLDGGKGFSDAEVKKRMADMTPGLMIYASNRFLKEWRAFRVLAASEPEPRETLLQMESVLKSFRSDLGHGTLHTQPGDLLAVFITDIDQALSAQPPTGSAQG